MAQRLEVYKCDKCGNIVEILHGGQGTLVCCDEPMKLKAENTVDASLEKHVPVVEPSDGGIIVKVGSVPHPMADEHYIEFIELVGADRLCRIWLKPGMIPEAMFSALGEGVYAREYCNIHGLWKG